MACDGSWCGIPPHPLGDHPCGCAMEDRRQQNEQYRAEMAAQYEKHMRQQWHDEGHPGTSNDDLPARCPVCLDAGYRDQ